MVREPRRRAPDDPGNRLPGLQADRIEVAVDPPVEGIEQVSAAELVVLNDRRRDAEAIVGEFLTQTHAGLEIVVTVEVGAAPLNFARNTFPVACERPYGRQVDGAAQTAFVLARARGLHNLDLRQHIGGIRAEIDGSAIVGGAQHDPVQ